VTDPDGLRASDMEREAAVERLRVASVKGRLTLGELTTRTEAAYTAQTRGELARVTADLPERLSSPASVPRARSNRMVSVFGDVTRSGWWRAEGTVSPMSLFGDIELDLRQAAVPVRHPPKVPHARTEVRRPEGGLPRWARSLSPSRGLLGLSASARMSSRRTLYSSCPRSRPRRRWRAARECREA
jgi:hypothetical protein